jgi:hypothetical protein
MCQFPTVNEVVLLIDGSPISTYHGISTANLRWKGDIIDPEETQAAPPSAPSNDGFQVDDVNGGTGNSGTGNSGGNGNSGNGGSGTGNDPNSPNSINIFY